MKCMGSSDVTQDAPESSERGEEPRHVLSRQGGRNCLGEAAWSDHMTPRFPSAGGRVKICTHNCPVLV
jgi:hypothetical protein